MLRFLATVAITCAAATIARHANWMAAAKWRHYTPPIRATVPRQWRHRGWLGAVCGDFPLSIMTLVVYHLPPQTARVKLYYDTGHQGPDVRCQSATLQMGPMSSKQGVCLLSQGHDNTISKTTENDDVTRTQNCNLPRVGHHTTGVARLTGKILPMITSHLHQRPKSSSNSRLASETACPIGSLKPWLLQTKLRWWVARDLPQAGTVTSAWRRKQTEQYSKSCQENQSHVRP